MDELNEKIKRVFADLGIRCAYNMPSFWANGGKDYVVIPTRYAKGYQKALEDAEREITEVLSEQPERMTNRQWVDFLSAQFDISRTSAKEMLHGMMRWKKEDNFKKMFNGGKT